MLNTHNLILIILNIQNIKKKYTIQLCLTKNYYSWHIFISFVVFLNHKLSKP